MLIGGVIDILLLFNMMISWDFRCLVLFIVLYVMLVDIVLFLIIVMILLLFFLRFWVVVMLSFVEMDVDEWVVLKGL